MDKLPDLRGLLNPWLYMSGEFEGKAIFEYQHQKRMLKKAAKYHLVFPSLEWIYFGQTFMTITRGLFVDAVALSEKAEDCRKPLRHVFSHYEV
jgi:hypothetical protein